MLSQEWAEWRRQECISVGRNATTVIPLPAVNTCAVGGRPRRHGRAPSAGRGCFVTDRPVLYVLSPRNSHLVALYRIVAILDAKVNAHSRPCRHPRQFERSQD